LVDPRTGFCAADTLVVTAEVIILQETVAFDTLDGLGGTNGGTNIQQGRPDAAEATGATGEGGRSNGVAAVAAAVAGGGDVLSGKFTWRVLNFSLFQARGVRRRRGVGRHRRAGVLAQVLRVCVGRAG
jgi:hypothetical protein